MIETLLPNPSGRQQASSRDPVSTDTGARRLIVTVMLPAIALDQSCSPAIAPALNAAAGAFALDRHATAWLDMSFNIGYLAGIFVSVWAIARFGKRRYLGWSLLTFAVTSLVCAIAPAPDLLIFARSLQGAGAGAFFTCGLLTIVATASKSDLPLAMVLLTAVMLIAPALAPLYGGALIEYSSWRLVFVGIAVVALCGAAITFRRMNDVTASEPRSFDATGFAALLVGLSSFEFLVTQGAGVGWYHATPAVVAGVAMFLAGWVYVSRQLRSAADPFLDLRVLGNGFVARGMLAAVFLGVLFDGAAIEAQFVRSAFALGPTATGAFIATRCAGIVAGVVATAVAGRRLIGARTQMILGLGIVSATYLALGYATVEEGSLGTHIVIGVMQGLGFAIVLGPFATVLFNSVERNWFAPVTVLFKLSVLLGSGIAVGLTATVFALEGTSVLGGGYTDLWLVSAAFALFTAALTATLDAAPVVPAATNGKSA